MLFPYAMNQNITALLAVARDVTQQTEQLFANYNRTLAQQVAQRTAALRKVKSHCGIGNRNYG